MFPKTGQSCDPLTEKLMLPLGHNFWSHMEMDLDTGRLIEKENLLCRGTCFRPGGSKIGW